MLINKIGHFYFGLKEIKEMFDFIACFHYPFFQRHLIAIREHPVNRSFTRFLPGAGASLFQQR
jgi:hypothetical protein